MLSLSLSADRYSFGTGCSSQSKEEIDGRDFIDQSTNDGRHYVKNRRSNAAEVQSQFIAQSIIILGPTS